MKNIILSLIILTISLPSFSSAKETVHSIRTEIQNGSLNTNDTCLDEYLDETKTQWWKTGLTPPVGAAGTVATGFVGMLAGAGLAKLLGITSWAALGYLGLGSFVGFSVGVATAATLETIAITKLVKYNFLIKTIAEAKQNGGKSFFKFLKKYDRKYPQDDVFKKVVRVTELLNLADAETKLCDGSLVSKKRGFFRNKNRKIANKNEIFSYLHAQLQL